MFAKKKIFITGGTGFLGCHLARAALKKGYDIILFDLAPLDARDLLGKVTYIHGDVVNAQELQNAIKGCDYVIHAAAALPIQRTKQAIFRVNIEGTRNVLRASLQSKVKRLVFISSTAVYGVPKHLPETEIAPLDPIGYYGQSKIAGEELCREYMKKGLQVTILRPKTFLGTERLGVFQLWFEAIYTEKPIFLLGNGNNLYQLLAVTDLVAVILKALTSKATNEIFNIGAEKFGTWRNDLGAVITHAKSQTKIISLPVLPSQMLLGIMEFFNMSPIAAWHYKTLPIDSYVSIEKAKKLLGWQPEKSNQELLIESYDWYASHREEFIHKQGITHRSGWNFGILNLLKVFQWV